MLITLFYSIGILFTTFQREIKKKGTKQITYLLIDKQAIKNKNKIPIKAIV